ncbi:peptide transporter family 1-like isoform X2 [Macrosteles quadrilineatus]|uniref:peptide transporter family 1-like isoform X2 n=1 Tax=Macrosteles quadrilineatus TaxID=74068 RepID=UPI0023E0CB2D|nr:peptide transporter family 1-like isoform X2 [Macrosteles quadrilineatus]
MVLETVEIISSKHRYPKSVFFIVGNEFCERFSYYGMRTILSLYLVDILRYNEDSATLIYHAFAMFCYFFPLFGAILSDCYLGKFKTIFYLSLVYAAGNIVISSSSSPLFGVDHKRFFSLLGLLLIAVGTGGIKPCVSSFGGDQFVLPQQAKQLAQFFSLFYFSINAGSLLSTYLTPVLRHDVQCFGEDTCFPLAFGVPALLMVIALIIFLLGKKQYVCKNPEGNIVVDVSKCVSHAVCQKVQSAEKKEHWLDHSVDRFGQGLVNDTKAAMAILWMFLPLPFFWALYDQQGSRWTFQATRMDGRLGPFTIKPDQMQVVNPFLILTFIPLFDSVVYPALARCHLLTRPLQRLSVGGLLAALAFLVSAFVEMKLEATYPVLPKAGISHLRIFNGLDCAVDVQSSIATLNGRVASLDSLPLVDIPLTDSAQYTLNFTTLNCPQLKNVNFTGAVTLTEAQAVSLFLHSTLGVPTASQVPGFDAVQKDSVNPIIRVLFTTPPKQEVLKLTQDGYSKNIVLHNNTFNTLPVQVLKTGRFELELGGNKLVSNVELNPAGIYTLIVNSDYNDKIEANLVTVTPPNSVHMLWLLPQYIIITAAEIMFSITGLDFSFTQAPVSMKSLISAAWLLTTAFGNLIVVIVAEVQFFESQVHEFILFAVLMVIDMVIFIFMALNYKYYNPNSNSSSSKEIPAEKQND